MKTKLTATFALLALGLPATQLLAQDGPPAEGPRGQRPPPLVAALDANHDGVIDSNEIATASAALKSLDQNGDGDLTREELLPAGMQRRGDRTGPKGPRPEGQPPGVGFRPVVPPVIAALDANHDGTVDETELNNSVDALKALDKNNDGKLTKEELRPQRPEGMPPRGPRPDGNGPDGDFPPPPPDENQ